MLAYLFLTLLIPILTRSQANPAPPECTLPPPPASSLPTLSDCLTVLNEITEAASKEGNTPQVWSRQPRAPGHGYWLPYSFSSYSINNCDLVVDAPAGRMDIFATKYVASAAKELIKECLVGTSPESATVGKVVVGPRKVVKLTLKRKTGPLGTVGDGLGNTTVDVNGTGGGLVQDAPGGEANLTMAE
ncbi:hypothetical protein OEA41_007413 [Lepraria neglecta]|uniref:Uncharacterized protein n=1 Tax=Lepraria neglecta TaxID=209136 RepID=A0AAD9ZD13_9LECA|nr:hypothetical protein OEA41_007413 [Lepraria neglecta]